MVAEERDALLRQLLAFLPASTLASLTDRAVGRPLQSAAELSSDELRRLRTAQVLQAARQIRRPTDMAGVDAPHGPHTAAVPPTARVCNVPAVSMDQLSAGVAGVAAIGAAGGSVRPLTSASATPDVTRQPSIGRSPSISRPFHQSERMGLPPLPVAPAVVFPALIHDFPHANAPPESLSLAAYECLLLTVKVRHLTAPAPPFSLGGYA